MKKFLAILVLSLFLITPSQAADIRDFQIEGMSVGDSLLDYYSKEEIELRLSKIISKYKSDKFIRISFPSGFGSKEFELYEFTGAHFKKKDSTYKIHALSGALFIHNKSKCIKKHDEIVKDLSKIFTNKPQYNVLEDEEGEFIRSRFFLDNGNIRVACNIWNEEMIKKYNWSRALRVMIMTNTFVQWLNNEAY